MQKQTIEIDVPEGEEVDLVLNFSSGDYPALKSHALITFKKKEPEFIEVRAYLLKTVMGNVVACFANKGLTDMKELEASERFIRWIEDWQKVEI